MERYELNLTVYHTPDNTWAINLHTMDGALLTNASVDADGLFTLDQGDTMERYEFNLTVYHTPDNTWAINLHTMDGALLMNASVDADGPNLQTAMRRLGSAMEEIHAQKTGLPGKVE
jgi:hypothetical protein